MRAFHASQARRSAFFRAVAACSAFALTVEPKRYSRDLVVMSAEFADQRRLQQVLLNPTSRSRRKKDVVRAVARVDDTRAVPSQFQGSVGSNRER
jgi:hypothetical protein